MTLSMFLLAVVNQTKIMIDYFKYHHAHAKCFLFFYFPQCFDIVTRQLDVFWLIEYNMHCSLEREIEGLLSILEENLINVELGFRASLTTLKRKISRVTFAKM